MHTQAFSRVPQTLERTRPAPPCSPPPRLTPALQRTDNLYDLFPLPPPPPRLATQSHAEGRCGGAGGVPGGSRPGDDLTAPAATAWPAIPAHGRAEAGAEPRQPVPRADAGGFFSARQARPGARGRRGSLLGRAAGRPGRPPADLRADPTPTPRHAQARPRWTVTRFSAVIAGPARREERGQARSAAGLGQGTGGKPLSSSLDTASALGLWQKLGLGGLKPGRGAASGGAGPSLGADPLDAPSPGGMSGCCFQP